MTIIIIFAILFIIFIVFLIIFRILNSKPIYQNIRPASLIKYLNILYERGYDGGIIYIYDSSNKRFIQFIKNIKSKGDVHIELGFPRVKWTQKYYDILKDFLIKKNINYENINDKSGKVEFIVIDCKSDIGFCIFLINEIFIKIFDIKYEDLKYNIKYENVSPREEKIGF